MGPGRGDLAPGHGAVGLRRVLGPCPGRKASWLTPVTTEWKCLSSLPSCRWGDGGSDRPSNWLKVTQIMSGHSALVQTFNPIPREKTAGFSARTASPLLCSAPGEELRADAHRGPKPEERGAGLSRERSQSQGHPRITHGACVSSQTLWCEFQRKINEKNEKRNWR